MAAGISIWRKATASRASRNAVATICRIALAKAGLMIGAAMTMLVRIVQL